MFEDLLLKVKGNAPKVDLLVFKDKNPVMLTSFAYLNPRQFRIAEFIRNNPQALTKDISEGIDLYVGGVSVAMVSMFKNNIVTRKEVGNRGMSPTYSYTLAVEEFAIDTNIKRLSGEELTVIAVLKNLSRATSIEIAKRTKMNISKFYYLMTTLLKKGMIFTDSITKAKQVFQITDKGMNTIERGGIYEQGS